VSARPIVCAFDASEPARHATAVAAWLAAREDAPLQLIYVLDEGQLPALPRQGAAADPVLRDQLYTMQEGRVRVWARRELAAAADGLTGVTATYEVHDGRPVAVLLAHAAERRAELLVSGTAARGGLEHMLHGSVSGRLAAEAPCPVVTVPPDAVVGDDGPVLAGDDGSDHAARAVRHAAALAERLGRDLVTFTAEDGDAAGALAAEARARRACLIVTGTRGRGAVTAMLFGSVSTGLVLTAGRPFVMVSARAGEPG
jgi:nucleotide-binding universal stress UspA family protein